jgi:hypothetical protein
MNYEYPLQWNNMLPRSEKQERSRFGGRSVYAAGERLKNELGLLGAKNILITSNLKTKVDGGFYANQMRIEDAGICVYLELNGEKKCFACDKWDLPQDNIWALALNVSAIRGMERWGGSNFMKGVFTGFAQLPAPDKNNGINYFYNCETKEQVREKYIELAKKMHPDCGGNTFEFQEMLRQYNERK